jgi:hypothetical protein
MKLALEGAYDGTSFHRVVKYGRPGRRSQDEGPGRPGSVWNRRSGIPGPGAERREAHRGAVSAVQIQESSTPRLAVLHRHNRPAEPGRAVHGLRAWSRNGGGAEDPRDAGR